MGFITLIVLFSVALTVFSLLVTLLLAIGFYRWRHRIYDARLRVEGDEVLRIMREILAHTPGDNARVQALLPELREAEKLLFQFDRAQEDDAAVTFRNAAISGDPSPMQELITLRAAWIEEVMSRPYGPPRISHWLEYRR
jgi:hypothetical protein